MTKTDKQALRTLAKQMGFSFPISVTPRAWANVVAWTAQDTKRRRIAGMPIDRLYTLLSRAAAEADGLPPGEREIKFGHKRTPRKVRDGAEAKLRMTVKGKGRSRSLIIDLAA